MQIEIGWVIVISVIVATVAFFGGYGQGRDDGFKDGLDNNEKLKEFEDHGGDPIDGF